MNSLSNKGREKFAKAFTVLTSVTTMLSMSGVMYLAPVASAVAPADYGLKEGDVVSAAGSDDPDVYIVNEMGYKRLFLNPAIFNFYGHLGGFAAVKNVSAATRDAFGTSGLFRNCETNDPKVYGVETTGEDTGMLHWVNTSGAQAVADDANFFSKVFCINNNEFSWYPKGSDYTSVSQVPDYSRGGTVVTAGPVSVGLASTNPAAGTVVDTQARYNLANFLFSGNAAVNTFKLKRIGVSADASLKNVYLYDGNKRLTDSVTVSDGVMNFNDAGGLFTVAGSKVISVMAEVDGTAGETLGVQATGVNGNAVSVSGNLHTIATATLATYTLNTTTTPSTDGLPVPQNDFVAWQNATTVATRYVWLHSLQMRVVGSVAAGDLRNFRLFVDGVQVGSAIDKNDSDGYILFDMTGSPVKLETGNRTLKVLVDIVGGSSKNFYLSVRQKPDVWTTDSQYGAAIPTAGTLPEDSNVQTIASGTLTITKTQDSPSGDVVKGASGVVLSRFEFKAAGEKMKVENLRINNTTTGSAPLALRNAAIFADGVQVGSTTTLWEDTLVTASNSTAYAEVSLGSSLIVEPGTPRILEIRADIFDASGTDDTAANQVFTANFAAGATNVQRLTTLDYVSSDAKTGTSLTIKTGSLTANKYTGYANQSIVDPKTNVKVGHFTVTAASSENVNMTSLDFMPQEQTGTNFDGDEMTDTYVKVWNDAGSVIYTSPVKSAALSKTASTSFNVNFILPKNKTYQVEIWTNVDSTPSATDAVRMAFSATGTTVGSSTSSTTSVVAGQTITAQAGAFTVSNSSIPVATFVNGGVTKNVYNFTITPTYDDYYLDELYVDIGTPTTASNSGAIATIFLKDGSTTLSSAVLTGTGSASFTGLNLSLPQASGTKTLSVDVQFANVGVGSNDTGGSVILYLDGHKHRDSAGTITTVTGLSTTTYAANNHVLVKGYPTFTNVALPTTVLAAGSQTLFKTSVTATGGQIAWSDIVFTVASNSAAGTFTSFKLFENGVDITGSGTGSSSDIGATTKVEFVFTTERVITAGNSVTLELKATVGGTLAANDSVTTNITNPAESTVTTLNEAAQKSKAQATASFVWTDQSQASHSTTTDDWFTDGLLKTLAESQALTK